MNLGIPLQETLMGDGLSGSFPHCLLRASKKDMRELKAVYADKFGGLSWEKAIEWAIFGLWCLKLYSNQETNGKRLEDSYVATIRKLNQKKNFGKLSGVSRTEVRDNVDPRFVNPSYSCGCRAPQK